MKNLLVVCVVVAPLCAEAAAPALIQMQGTLRTGGGELAPDGPYGLTVSLFDAEVDGALLHEEIFGGSKSAVVADGVFDLVLGSAAELPTGLFAQADELWLQVQVEIDAPLPRSRLFSTPYALAAGHALTADALTFDVATQAELDAAVGGLPTDSDVADEVAALADLVYTKAEVDTAISAGLATVYTKAEVDTAIGAGLAAGYTKAEVDTAISTGLATLYTKAEVDTAISTGLAAGYTKAEVDTAISTGLATLYSKTETDSLLAGFLKLSGGTLTGPLTVGGSVTVANDAASCTAANAGAIRFTGTLFEGCNGTEWTLLGGAAAPSAAVVFTASALDTEDGKVIGTIPGSPGKNIRVIRVVICGDADAASGPAKFSAVGGGMDFSWAAGQNNPGATYFIGVTPPSVGGAARGFVYQTVSEVTTQKGAALTITMVTQNDYDALFCQATDVDGNAYADPIGSVRGWVRYQYE